MKSFAYKNIKVNGISVGGIESCYILPEYKIAFDMGRCPEELVQVPTVFLTHGHLDHSAGIAYYYSQRSLKGLPDGQVFMPKKIVRPMRKILKTWHKIEQFQYNIRVEGLKHHHETEIRKKVTVKSLPSWHRVHSQGYVLLEEKIKLKPEYLHLSGRKIQKMKEAGEDIFLKEKVPMFCYSGDTDIRFVKENPEVQKARVLFLECTYIDDKRPPERAHLWGHTHLYDIIAEPELFQNEKLVLVHFSRRYSAQQIEKTLKKKLPMELKNKTEFWA